MKPKSTTIRRPQATTRMEYSVSTPSGCVESCCGSLAEARRLARKLKASLRNSPVTIYRYDRAGKSKYNELVETL